MSSINEINRETIKTIAETNKLIAESLQIAQHMRWYVVVLAATGGGALVTFGMLIARFIWID